jgi:hypothetical protein
MLPIAQKFLAMFSHPQIHSRIYRGREIIHEEDLIKYSFRPSTSPSTARRMILASLGKRDPLLRTSTLGQESQSPTRIP